MVLVDYNKPCSAVGICDPAFGNCVAQLFAVQPLHRSDLGRPRRRPHHTEEPPDPKLCPRNVTSAASAQRLECAGLPALSPPTCAQRCNGSALHGSAHSACKVGTPRTGAPFLRAGRVFCVFHASDLSLPKSRQGPVPSGTSPVRDQKVPSGTKELPSGTSPVRHQSR